MAPQLEQNAGRCQVRCVSRLVMPFGSKELSNQHEGLPPLFRHICQDDTVMAVVQIMHGDWECHACDSWSSDHGPTPIDLIINSSRPANKPQQCWPRS